MANTHGTLGSLFTDIANAIRTKTKKTSSIVADNFPDEINSIVLGEGDAQPSDVKEGKTFTNDTGVQQTGTFAEQTKSTTSNGTVTPDSGKYLSSVTVNVSLSASQVASGGSSTTGWSSGKCLVAVYGLGLKCNDSGFSISWGSSGGSRLYNNYYAYSNSWDGQSGGGVTGLGVQYCSANSQYISISINSNPWGNNSCRAIRIPLS